jgi:hypothetical protein
VTSLELELIGPTQRVLKALAGAGQGLEREALDRLPSSWYITGFLVPITTDLSLRCDDTADDDSPGWMGSISAGPAARTRPTRLGTPGMMAAPAMAVHWDQLVKALQYRDAPEYGVGHNVGVEDDLEANGGCSRLRTTWIPQATVEKVSAREDVGCELGMEELDRLASEGYPAVREALMPLVVLTRAGPGAGRP